MTQSLKWHHQPDGAWQLTHALCGASSIHGIMTTQHVEYVTCLVCLEKLTRPYYQTKPTY